MRLAHRVKRSLVAGLAGAMVFALLPAGVAAAEVIDTDGLDACDGAEGLVDFNDALGFFESNIECMAAYGVTVGDADGNFNSPGSVTRQQMALFIARLATQALNGNTDIPATTDDEFDDIANINPPEARDAINLLASLGIVQGVSESEYDPSGTVTREQMASFVANAHAALEVDFTGFAPDAGVFGDEDEISDVHLDNVLLLADVGVVEGDAAGDYNPGNPVTRGQMSAFIVRSIAVLDGQGLWNGEFVAEPEVASQRVVAENIGEDTVYLSDGSAVTEYVYTDDSFEIDGTTSSLGAFEVFLADAPDVLIETRVEGGDVVHNVTSGELVLEGTIGNNDGDGEIQTPWAIVDLPSGVALTNITDDIVGETSNFFTVDGAAAPFADFAADISFGDYIEVEVVSAGEEEDFSDYTFRHNLTNQALDGTAAVVPATVDDVLIVDAVAGDDADVTTAAFTPHYTLELPDAADDVVYLVDGEDNDGEAYLNDEWLAAVETDAAVSYSKVDGVATYDVVSTEAVQTVTSGVVVGDGVEATPLNSASAGADALTGLTLLVSGDDGLEVVTEIDVEVTDADSITIDGVQSLVTELQDAISVGDTIVYGANGDFDAYVELTNGTVEDAQVIAFDDNITVQLAGTDIAVDVDPAGDVFGFGDTPPTYTVNGETEFTVDNEGTDVSSDTDATLVLQLLGNVNLVTTTVTVSLADDDGTPVWAFEGFTDAQIEAAVIAVQ